MTSAPEYLQLICVFEAEDREIDDCLFTLNNMENKYESVIHVAIGTKRPCTSYQLKEQKAIPNMTRYTPSRFWDRRLFKGTKKVVGEFSTSPEGPARLSSGAKARLKKLHRKQWSYFTRQLSIFFARQAIIIKQRRALWAHLPFIKNWPVGDRDWSRNSQKGIYVYYHPLGTWGEAEVLFSGSGTHSSSFSTESQPNWSCENLLRW